MSSSHPPASTPPGDPDAIDDKLAPVRSGDEAADRIYRRLMARRRRWVDDELIVEPNEPETAPDEEGGKDRPASSQPVPVADPAGSGLRQSAAPPHRAAVFVPPVAVAGEGRAAEGRTDEGRADHNRTSDDREGNDRASDGRTRNYRAGSTRDADTASRSHGAGSAGDARGAGSSGSADAEDFSLQRWQPRSHTVRFIKDHPGLAAAIGVPAVLLLTRRGMAGRALRYATSPAGMATIRRIGTVATALGLLGRTRR